MLIIATIGRHGRSPKLVEVAVGRRQHLWMWLVVAQSPVLLGVDAKTPRTKQRGLDKPFAGLSKLAPRSSQYPFRRELTNQLKEEQPISKLGKRAN